MLGPALLAQAQKISDYLLHLIISQVRIGIPFGLSKPLCVVVIKVCNEVALISLRSAIDSNDGAGGFEVGMKGWSGAAT